MTEINKRFARVFSTPDGRAVIAHLRRMTIERPLSPDLSDNCLRWIAAQSALVHKIETLIEGGK